MKVAEAFVELRVDSTRAEGEVKQKASSLGKTFASIFGAAAFGAALNKSIQAFSRLEQAVGATEAVFDGSNKTIDRWAKGSVKAFGLSEAAAREALAGIGAQLQNFGFSVDDSISKGQELIGLGADMAATFGGTTADAIQAVSAALRGEFDTIEKYAVTLGEVRVKNKALELGLYSGTGAIDANAKATATLALIQEQTTKIQGQWNRELGTTASKQQMATAEAENAAASLGEVLAPAYNRVVDVVTKLVGVFGELPGPVQVAVVALAGLVLLSGPLSAFKDIVVATKAAMSNMGVGATGLAAGVAALGGVLYAATKIYSFYADEKRKAQEATEEFTAALQAEKNGTKDAVNQLIAVKLGGTAVTAAVDKMGIGWKSLTEYIRGNTSPEFDFLETQFKDTAGWTSGLGQANEYLRDTYGLTEAEAGALLAAIQETRTAYAAANVPMEQQAIILDALNDETAAAAANARDAAVGTDTWTGALTTLYTAIQSNADEADRFRQILDDILNPYINAEEASRAYEQALDDITAAIKENGATLDITTEAGRANREELQAGADAILGQAQSMVEQGYAAEDVAAATALYTENLRNNAVAAGLSEEQVDAYIQTLGLTPDNVNTVIQLAEIDQRKAELDDMLGQLGNIDETEAIADIKAKIERGELDEAERDIRALAAGHDIPLAIKVTGPRNIVVVPTSLGYTINRYAQGGYIGKDQLAYLDRDEVVLPLTNPTRMAELLGDPRVGDRVAAAAGSYTTTGSSSAAGSSSWPAAAGDTYVLVGWDDTILDRLEARQRQRERGRR